MTYKELDNIIYNAFNNHSLIKDVVKNSNSINSKNRKYWAAAYDLTNLTVTEDLSTYSFNFYVLERMTDEDNSINNYSIGIEILKDILQDIEDQTEGVQYPVTFQCSSVKFADVLDVVQATVQITVENSTDCE